MRPRANGFTSIVQKQSQIEYEWIVESLKNFAIGNQLRIIRLRQCIEFVDADQRMFIGCVTMQKLMLHQTRQLAEFGNVSPQKIDSVHHAKDACRFTFP